MFGDNSPAIRRLRLAFVLAATLIVAMLFLTPVGSQLILVGEAQASTDIDPCGTGGESVTPVNHNLGFDVGSGPAALVCSYKSIGYPPWSPQDLNVKAPDAGNIDPKFASGFPYMIGPDGAEVNYNAITGSQILKEALESVAGSLAAAAIGSQLFPPVSWAAGAGGVIIGTIIGVLQAVIGDLIDEEEAMQGADWDWSVPSVTGTGDWYSWFTWTGTGGFVNANEPAITPSSVNPAIGNWYTYNINDPYYQDPGRAPNPYVRVFIGSTRVSMQQGPGITAKAESLARDASNGAGFCAGKPLPACYGSGLSSASTRRSDAAELRFRKKRVGKAILQTSELQHSIVGTGRNDEVRAPHGARRIRVGGGHDQVIAGRGANHIFGGGGSDELTSLSGHDLLKGGSGHDVLQGGGGGDASVGGGGSDSLFDNNGADRMFAGKGADRIVTRDKRGDDRIDCGSGRDMVIADPSDRVVLNDGGTVAVGEFTAGRTPKGASCELVFSSVHMPPRNPPAIGHHAGRPPTAPEPSWPVFD